MGRRVGRRVGEQVGGRRSGTRTESKVERTAATAACTQGKPEDDEWLCAAYSHLNNAHSRNEPYQKENIYYYYMYTIYKGILSAHPS